MYLRYSNSAVCTLVTFATLISGAAVPRLSAATVSIPITNFSFENGTMGWTNGGGVFSASPPTSGMFNDPVPDGESVLYLGGASPGPAFAAQNSGATVTANTSYDLSFWVGLRAEAHIQPTPYRVSVLPSLPTISCAIPAAGRNRPTFR